MPALEPLIATRVVADPAALDEARWSGSSRRVTVLRVAPDEAIGIGTMSVEVVDAHAIVVPEHGLVGASCSFSAIERHIDWRLPPQRPVLAQGAVAGVPVRLWSSDGDEVLLVTAAAYADELADRLGWSR